MSLSLYTASVPAFNHMLGALRKVLLKGEQHATALKIDPTVLLQMRLYPDMFPLVRQVQIACDFAKSVPLRLANREVPAIEDKEQSFADLYARIDSTLTLIAPIQAEDMLGAEEREIVLRPGTPREMRFNGEAYLVHYGLPQFYFHVTTTYAILRHAGVVIGKGDYMGRS